MDRRTKKLRTPECSPFDTFQLLFQAFFNIPSIKRDIKEKLLTSKFTEG